MVEVLNIEIDGFDQQHIPTHWHHPPGLVPQSPATCIYPQIKVFQVTIIIFPRLVNRKC